MCRRGEVLAVRGNNEKAEGEEEDGIQTQILFLRRVLSLYAEMNRLFNARWLSTAPNQYRLGHLEVS